MCVCVWVCMNISYFVTCVVKQKHDAVERVFNQLPEDSVKSIASSVDAGDKSHLPFDTRNALKEYLGFKAYLVSG